VEICRSTGSGNFFRSVERAICTSKGIFRRDRQENLPKR
jgi:hypothetical protein